MSRRRASPLRVGVSLAAVALLIGPLAAIPAARADNADSRFLAQLDSEGIRDGMSPSHAIDAAHTVCQKLDDGLTPAEVANDVLSSSAMPAYHSGYFVGASIDVYCPWHKTKVSGNS